MNREDMIKFVRSYSGCKDPGFSTETVGMALGSDYSRLYLDKFEFDSVSTEKLSKIVRYMRAALRAASIEYELWSE